MDREPSNAELMTALVAIDHAVTHGFAMMNTWFDRLETRCASTDELKGSPELEGR